MIANILSSKFFEKANSSHSEYGVGLILSVVVIVFLDFQTLLRIIHMEEFVHKGANGCILSIRYWVDVRIQLHYIGGMIEAEGDRRIGIDNKVSLVMKNRI
ncbi:unnamed protein product [Rotaria sp. Silwood1]|nr:unnamed protein product [Rotaria sp. Silwood1]